MAFGITSELAIEVHVYCTVVYSDGEQFDQKIKLSCVRNTRFKQTTYIFSETIQTVHKVLLKS